MNAHRAGPAAVRLAAAGAVAGLALAAALTVNEPVAYTSVETLVLVSGSTPVSDSARAKSIVSTLRVLAESRVVTANVADALQLREAQVRDHVHVGQAGATAAVRLRGESSTDAGAVRLVQQYGIVLTDLVRTRFAPLALAPFDPAHADGRGSRPWTRNLLVGLVLGALAGAGLSRVSRTRLRTAVLAAAAWRGARASAVTLATPPASPPEPPAAPVPPLESRTHEPEPLEPEEPEPEPEPDPSRPGAVTIAELRRRVEEARAAHPAERVAEWDLYLELLSQHAVHGVVPQSFDVIIDDVFGSLLY